MRKLICHLFFCFILYTGAAQNGSSMKIGTIDSIHSKILNENRKIWVYLPDSWRQEDFAKVKYPVVYLLDGDQHFYSVASMIQELSSVNGNSVCPEMIVVGIPNTDRTRDLTPTHVDFDPMMNGMGSMTTSGGGEQFITFIKKELIPYIDSAYPTLPYRTIIGHSFGGLTVINTLIHHKELFTAYVAIDPSMWWDRKNLLAEVGHILTKEDYKGKCLFLGIANTMRRGMKIANAKKDTSLRTLHIRSILSLNELLQKNRGNGLLYDSKYYIHDDHASVPLIATYDALHSIFKFYDFKLDPEPFLNISMKIIAKLEKHFQDISKYFGFPYHVPEAMTNHLGYSALSQKKLTEAEYLFKTNVANYPTSFNVYDSMGDFYVETGEKQKAVENYIKALAIKESSDTRNKLKALMIK